MLKSKHSKIIFALLFVLLIFVGSKATFAQDKEAISKDDKAKTTQINKASNNIIAELTGKANVSSTNPITGTNFSMDIQLNSKSNGSEVIEDIKGYTLAFTIPEHIEFKGVSNSSLYEITPPNPKAGDVLKIKLKDDLAIAQLTKVKVNFAFKAGTTISDDSFAPKIDLSADNATAYSFNSEEAKARTLDVSNVFKVETDDSNPSFAHRSIIKLLPENYYGGINHQDGKLVLDFDAATEIHSIKYGNREYTTTINSEGRKEVIINIGDLKVGEEQEEIILVYSYPPLLQEGSKDYYINMDYTAKRYRTNEIIKQNKKINETVIYEVGSGDSKKYFYKSGTKEVYRRTDQPLTYELDFKPQGDTKNAALIDDPARGNEADFFEGVDFTQVKWQAYPGHDPKYDKGINTSVSYALKSNPNTWIKGSEPSLNGSFNLDNVAADGDYVVKIKLEYSYNGSKVVPAQAGHTLARVFAKTKSGITQENSLKDGITNSVYLTGQKKSIYASEFEDIKDDGASNFHYATTTYREALPELGFSEWQNPFNPSTVRIGQPFKFRINVSNVGGAKADKLVAYLTTSSKFEMLDIKFPNGDNTNTTVEARDNGDKKTYIIRFNDTLNANGWDRDSKFQVEFTAKALPGASDGAFTLQYSTDDPNTKFGGSNANKSQWLIPNVGFFQAGEIGVKFTSYINISTLLNVTSTTKASVDDINYETKASKVITNAAGDDGYYLMNISNDQSSESNLDQVNIIDMLPRPNDTMTISGNAKNSNYAPIVKALLNEDGTPVSNTTYDLYYATDSTFEKNRDELNDHTAVTTTWQAWDGASDLPSDANAIKIIKKDGLAKGEHVNLKLKVNLPSGKTGLNVAWNAISASGSYTDTTGRKVYTTPGEPNKAGIYISDNIADQELGGVIWEDENGNHLRDNNEKTISDKVVKLYDWNGDFIDETTTNNQGEYKFSNLYQAKYRVEFENSITYKFADYKFGNDRSIDNNFSALNGDERMASANVNLASETNPLNIDAGLYREVSIGDYIWDDSNNNGIQDINESGVANASISLYKVDDDNSEHLIKTIKSDNTGKYIFSKLNPGQYKIKVQQLTSYRPTEVSVGDADSQVNSKLERNWETKSFNVKSNQNLMSIDLGLTTFANTGSIVLDKVDENNAPLAGAVFGLWPKDANTQTELPLITSTSDNLGKVVFANVMLGEYTVQEYKAPHGYIFKDTKYAASLDDANLIKDLGKVENEKVSGSISLTKQGENAQLLSGVEFGLWNKGADVNNVAPITKVKTVNGKLKFDNLEVGDYIVKETKTIGDYKENNKLYEATIDSINYEIDLGTILNYKVEGSLNMKKVDQKNNPLANATFGVWNKRDNSSYTKPILKVTSDKKGNVEVKGLPVGQYYLKEINAPKGYKKSDKNVSFIINKENPNAKLEKFINTKKDDKIPKTGLEMGIIAGLFGLLGISLYVYKRKLD
ncbi:MAG: SpaA isopeptide-forming pilin-related protein [Erysipelotrichales bacterium]